MGYIYKYLSHQKSYQIFFKNKNTQAQIPIAIRVMASSHVTSKKLHCSKTMRMKKANNFLELLRKQYYLVDSLRGLRDFQEFLEHLQNCYIPEILLLQTSHLEEESEQIDWKCSISAGSGKMGGIRTRHIDKHLFFWPTEWLHSKNKQTMAQEQFCHTNCLCKQSFIGTQSCLLIYILSMIAFRLQQWSRIVATETT